MSWQVICKLLNLDTLQTRGGGVSPGRGLRRSQPQSQGRLQLGLEDWEPKEVSAMTSCFDLKYVLVVLVVVVVVVSGVTQAYCCLEF